MASLVPLLIAALISTTSCTVNVVYLRGVPRLSNIVYWDDYFHCNATGSILQWRVNGSDLGGFLIGDNRNLSGTKSSFNYTATVLSSQPTTGLEYVFDSVLIVSLLGRSSLDVTCRNGPSFKSTNNAESRRDVENKTNTSSIYLELLLTQTIFTGINTRFFVCGVDNQVMIWQTNTDTYAFNISDRIGQSLKNQNDTQQAIVIANEPFQIVSVLFVTDTSVVSVRCGHNQEFLQFVSTTTSEGPSAKTDPEPITSVASSKSILM